jgi:predicted amidohydrolase YtcJ
MKTARTGGLREAHSHIFQHGRSLGMVDLSLCQCADDAIAALAQRVLEMPNSAVLAHGARPESWEHPMWPTLEQLDAMVPDRPLVAWCFDYHALVANSVALRAAGFHRGTPDPPGGIIGRTTDGQLTGVVYEHAALAVWNAVPEPSRTACKAMVRAGVMDLVIQHGFTEIHDLKAQRWLAPILADIADELGSRVRFEVWPLLEDLPAVLDTRSSWESPLVRLGGAKIFVDGTLNSRTAWMLHPFADGWPEHPCGTPMMTELAIESAVKQCDAAGVPLAAHAIGDGAVRAVLDAIERVHPSTGGFRIEHCEVIDEADVARFAALGVIASVQPCHLLYDIEALRRGVPDRLDRVLPLRDLLDSGLEPGVGLVFGSDVPIVRPHPADSIRGAVERYGEQHRAELAIGVEQALTADEAWACFTPIRS